MTKRRTAIDANVLIASWSGDRRLYQRALQVLEDSERVLIVSDALWLETVPKAIYMAQAAESAFYQMVFARSEHQEWSPHVVSTAKRLAQQYGLAAMDAVHIAVALVAKADEFVSAERPSKPMFRVTEIATVSLWNEFQ